MGSGYTLPHAAFRSQPHSVLSTYAVPSSKWSLSNITTCYCLSQCPLTVKRYRDHGNSYKGEHFIRAGLVHCWHGGSMAAHRQTWCWGHWRSTSGSAGIRERDTLGMAWAFETPDLRPVIYFLQQSHTYPSKDTPPSRASIPVDDPVGAIPIKPPHYCCTPSVWNILISDL